MPDNKKYKDDNNDFKQKFKKLYNEKCSKYPDAGKDILDHVDRIIVIGDLHGDWEQTLNSFRIANLIDRHNNWIGGNTVVVQVGDQIDRCRQLPCNRPTNDDENSDVKILKFFTDLHSQAQKKGGAIYSIIGNHELMNSTGRMEYVSYQNYKNFESDPENENFLKGMPSDLTDMEARKWAFKPGNPLADFVACTRKLALIIGDHLFVHAGIVPKIARKYPNISDLNMLLSLYLWDKLDNVEKYQDIFGTDVMKGRTPSTTVSKKKDFFKTSPLWNRQFGNMKDNSKNCRNLLGPLKTIYKVNHLYVGHTPQMNKGINSICDGGLWFTDIGVSKAFDVADMQVAMTGKRSEVREASVLEILRGQEPRIIRGKSN